MEWYGLDWIFVGKVVERININSNQKLHPKSYVLRGGHILRVLHQVDTHLSVRQPQWSLVKYAPYWYSVSILHWPFQFYCTQNFSTRLFPRPFTAFCLTFLIRIFSEWTSSFSFSALQFGDIELETITKNCCTEWNNWRQTRNCGLY